MESEDPATRVGCIFTFSAVAILLVLLFALAASAEDKVSYFRRIEVAEGPQEGSITCMGCSVIVRGDVNGDVVTLWGDVTVYGTVRADIVAVGGAVNLKNGSAVGRDVVALGGPISTEGTVATPGKDAFTAMPWMHLPGQPSVGWRGAIALLGFHVVCVLLPVLILRPRAVQSVAKASRRWLVTGLLGALVIVAYSYGLNALDENVRVSELVETVLAFLFLVVFGIGLAGITFAIGDRLFPGLLIASLAIGTIVLAVLELIPYAGFVVMVLVLSWATGAALWSGLGFRGPRPPMVPKGPASLKLTP